MVKLMWKLHVELSTLYQNQIIEASNTFVSQDSGTCYAAAQLWIDGLREAGYMIVKQSYDLVNMNN